MYINIIFLVNLLFVYIINYVTDGIFLFKFLNFKNILTKIFNLKHINIIIK